MRRLLVIGSLLALAACGADENNVTEGASGDTTAVPPPSCSEIWVAGQTLPEDYDGCVDEDGVLAPVEPEECSDGSLAVTHADRYRAVLGGTIEESAGTGTAACAS